MKSLLCIFLVTAPAWAGPILTLTPSTDIQGNQAGFAGWGYTLSGIPGLWAVPTFSEFSAPPEDGLYSDFVSLASNFVVVAPGDSGGQAYDHNLQTGIGELFIGATAGSTVAGELTLHYDLYSSDPNVDPVIFQLDNTITVDARIDVQNGGPSAVPEPATWRTAAGALLFLVGAYFRRRHNPSWLNRG